MMKGKKINHGTLMIDSKFSKLKSYEKARRIYVMIMAMKVLALCAR